MADEKKTAFKINVDKYGGINVEAPTKTECIELFDAAAKKQQKSSLDGAIV